MAKKKRLTVRDCQRGCGPMPTEESNRNWIAQLAAEYPDKCCGACEYWGYPWGSDDDLGPDPKCKQDCGWWEPGCVTPTSMNFTKMSARWGKHCGCFKKRG